MLRVHSILQSSRLMGSMLFGSAIEDFETEGLRDSGLILMEFTS